MLGGYPEMALLKWLYLALHCVATVTGFIASLWQLGQGSWAWLAPLLVFGSLLLLTQNRLAQPLWPVWVARERVLRGTALGGVALALLLAGRGGALWWSLVGLGLLLLLLRWQWKR